MKLLFITQKVDKNDSVLGTYHRWIEKFAEYFDFITVTCLYRGECDLSKNVKILSLGKEKEKSRFQYLKNFYSYIWGERKNYDVVFVHMNQEYVLLGGLLWKILGKKIFMWRNHAKGNFLTSLAVALAKKVFYTSEASYIAQFKKAVKMPVGVDVEAFRSKNPEHKANSVLSLGRISPVKNVHLMVEAARILWNKKLHFTLDIMGDPVNKEDFAYKENLVKNSADLTGAGVLNFYQGVPNNKTAETYSKYEIFLNLTPSGSFDKTIIEATACGCLTLTGNRSLQNEGPFGELVIPSLEPKVIAISLEHWLNVSKKARNEILKKLQDFVYKNHSLNALTAKLKDELR